MAKFGIRARAVDLLGRQQIAGIPTALHELFKNAHDAYASRVEVDYFRSQRQLILRDDGDGMSQADFISKWLTLGTESKVGANQGEVRDAPRGLKARKMLGEKGIGRLAIAAIGPVVLILTREDPEKAPLDVLTVAMVHWGLFEIPGIDLASIDIPVTTFPGGHVPDRDDINEMVEIVRQSLEHLLEPNSATYTECSDALNAMAEVDPRAMQSWLADAATREERRDLSLTNGGHGTHFIVAPVDSILDADIDSKGTWGSSPFERLLLGFGNTLEGDDADFVAEFRDHLIDGRIRELIGARSFFSIDEFASLDHHFEGEFDEFGQFNGTVQLYRGEPQRYVLSWPKAAGRPTECGPFRLRLGYLMGLADESRLPRDDHGPMYDKLNRLGGLYVYRDGIRVLPYGNSDYDFLNIEQRRTLAAKDWFFSYRRMIGWVDISHDENSSLVEKAGREGFRENRPYRQFREILENFFRQLAIDYFRERSDLGDDFRREREKLREDSDRLKKRESSLRGRKTKFASDLQTALAKIEAGEPAIASAQALDDLRLKLDAYEEQRGKVEANLILEVESGFYNALHAIGTGVAVARPRGLAPSKSVEAAWRTYERVFANLQTELLEPTRSRGSTLIEAFRIRNELSVDRQRRATEILDKEKNASLAEVRKLRREAESAMVKVDRAVRDAVQEEIGEFQRYVESLVATLSSANLDDLPESEAYERQRGLERSLDDRLQVGRDMLESVRDQLIAVATAVGQRDDLEETAAALERRNVDLQDRLDLYTDMAQAGSAVGILGHEFENVASGLRKSIDQLKPWADGTPGLKRVYTDISSFFDELADYLALFAPLSRRRYRRRTKIAGSYVEKYVVEALSSRLDEAKISLEVTDAFRQFSVLGTLPALLGAALNIVDNALYWTSQAEGERLITLDADSTGWLFSNSGPGIPLRMEERIFDFGVSTKPGGRGMGLAISQDALRKIGCDLTLIHSGANDPPVFRLSEQGEKADGSSE